MWRNLKSWASPEILKCGQKLAPMWRFCVRFFKKVKKYRKNLTLSAFCRVFCLKIKVLGTTIVFPMKN